MNDLFDSMEEAVTEREAIMLADAIPFDEEKRHACEVSWVMRTMYHDEQRTDEYFKLVEKKRNKEAADKLRHACDVSWVMDTIYPDGKRAAEHFVRLEKKRGKEATDKLRESCREKWKTWKIADSIVGQA
jgi:hypothetical protein